MTVVAQGTVRPVTLIGVTSGYREIRRLVVFRGRYLDSLDMESRSKTCVITPQLAKRLFGQDNPVGRDLHVGELIFTIIGVFNERVETFGLSDIQSETVLIPFGLIKYYTGVNTLKVLDAQAATPEDVPSVQRQIGGVAREPASERRGVQRADAGGDFDCGEGYFAGADDCA